MSEKGVILFGLGLMAALLMLEQFTDFDVLISNHFYDFSIRRWMVSGEDHQRLRLYFYDGPKILVAAIGTCCVLYMLSAFKVKRRRKNLTAVLTVLLCTMLVPTIVSRLKRVTNVYCPAQLTLYGGEKLYVKILEPYPPAAQPEHPGRCFPAGHVTGAFSLVSLYFLFAGRHKKFAAAAGACLFGCVTGGYQMLRGEHFLSHNLFSGLIAVVVAAAVFMGVKQISNCFARYKRLLWKPGGQSARYLESLARLCQKKRGLRQLLYVLFGQTARCFRRTDL